MRIFGRIILCSGAAAATLAQASFAQSIGTASAAPSQSAANPLSAVSAAPSFVDGASAVAPPAAMTPLPAGLTAGTIYQYNSLRVVNDAAPRGCGYGDWNCMANICKADLGASAWRGWGGCWTTSGKWICYFECSSNRQVQ